MTNADKPKLGDGPYRSAPLSEPDEKPRWPWLLMAAPIVASLLFMMTDEEPKYPIPDIDDLDPPLVDAVPVFPLPTPELQRATPLEPLLAADAPDALAILAPYAGATRLTRNQTIRFRFNRPMVPGSQVGKPIDEPPLVFDPPVPGTAEWTSRSSFVFRPAASSWSSSSESRVAVADWVRSLDGSEVVDEDERVVVFDATPRLTNTSGQNVAAGAPLPLLFDNRINNFELQNEVFAYEIGGGARSIPITVRGGDMSERGYRVELMPGRDLEAGANIGVAIAPRWTPWGGSSPSVVRFTIQPPPRIDGVACADTAPRYGGCRYGPTPGAVVDIATSLRLQATEPLADLDSAQIVIVPPLPERRVRLDESRRIVVVEGEWAPDQVYEVRVGELLTSTQQRLRRTPPLAVRSAGYGPEVRVEGGRFAWERGADPWIYFSGVHLEEGALYYRAVTEGDELRAALQPEQYATADGASQLPLLPLAPSARPNRWGEGRFEWKDSERNAKMAVVAFRAGAVPRRGSLPSLPTILAQETDLGVTVRVLREGVLVWVTSLASATPIDGATVTVANTSGQTIVEGRTGEQAPGSVWLASEQDLTNARIAVRARHGEDRAVLVVEHGRAVGPARLGLASGAEPPSSEMPVASVFADRGAYRPGERVRVRATTRRIVESQITPLRNASLGLRLMGPSSRVPVGERRVQTNRFGSVSAEFVLPRSAALGEYRAELVWLIQRPAAEGQTEPPPPEHHVIGSATLRVASFRQPTFRVDVEDRTALLAGEPLRLEVSARYLFGAPVRGGALRWSLYRDGGATYPRRYEQFTFGPLGALVSQQTLESGDAELSAEGALAVDVVSAVNANVREKLSFEAEVTDATGQTISSTRHLTLFPGDFEVGLLRGDDWVEMGEPLDVRAIVIDNEGEPVPGRAIEARIVREGWHSWWEWARGQASSGYQMRREQQREVVHRCELTSGTDAVSCSYAPSRSGTYVLEVETKDESGRASIASRRLYVAGPDEAPDRDPPGAPIAITPTRRKWGVGENAELAFESPFERARALITVEQNGVLYVEEREVGAGGQRFTLPINERMVPNVFVSVALVRPRIGEPGRRFDILGPDLRFGAVELKIMPGAAQYDVNLEAPTEAAPGSEVEVSVEVRGPNGPAQTEVVLWAVDEGTLRLTSYEVPDPTTGLFPTRPPVFSWEDLRRMLVSRIEPPAWQSGGDGGEAESTRTLRPEDSVMEPNPLWMPHLVTNEAGRARARFRLPERNTEYRIMAIAMDDGVGFGSNERKLTASRPIVLQDALPLFATRGDRFEAAVFVANATDAARTANIDVLVNGERVTTERVELGPKAQRRISHSIEVGGTEPTMTVAFATQEEGGMRVERRVPVAPRGRYRRAYAFGAVQGSPGSERNPGIRLDLPQVERGRLTLRVASHPFVGMNAITHMIDDSPWGGLQHKAAALMALASELALRGRIGGDLPGEQSPEELRARGTELVMDILAMQTHDGSFGRWGRSSYSYVPEAAFAVHALLLARDVDVVVPYAQLAQGIQWLERACSARHLTASYDMSGPDAHAYGLRVLKQAGKLLHERATELFENREQLTLSGLADLALALEDDDERRETLLVAAVETVFPPPKEEEEAGDSDAATAPTGEEQGETSEGDEEDDDEYEGDEYEGDEEHSEDADEAPEAEAALYVERARVLAPVLEAASVIGLGRIHAAPLAGKLLSLADSSAPFAFETAVDAAAAARAMAAYARLFATFGDLATLELDGQPLTSVLSGETTAVYQLPIAELGGGEHQIVVHTDGSAPAFFALDGEWSVPLTEADEEARGRRVSVHRRYETSDGRTLRSGDTVQLGEMVRVRLFLYTEQRPPMLTMLYDPLAAGFESVDRGFDTNARQSLMAMLGMGPDDDAVDPRGYHAMRSISSISHRALEPNATLYYFDQLQSGLQELTYVVRATTVGTFTIPPAQIDAAFDRDFVGRSTAFEVRVVSAR